VSPRVVIDASDAGDLLLLKTVTKRATAVAEIWALNTAHTIRMRQKRKFDRASVLPQVCEQANPSLVPVWDDIIPYSAHGDKRSAVVQQGFGLSFVVFEKGHRETHSIPTTWVTYKFWKFEGTVQILLPARSSIQVVNNLKTARLFKSTSSAGSCCSPSQ
jgi:hypothetical protein